MKPKNNPFVRSASLAAIVLTLGSAARADMFDLNGTTGGFGVADAGSYDWHAANVWAPNNDPGTTAPVTWVNGTRGAFFVGAGTGTNYTVRLGSGGSTATTLQNLALNVNAASSGQLTGSGGNVTIGNTGDTGILTLNAANSVGTYGGTLTVNNGMNLNGFATNFRGGTMIINGSITGTGASNISSGGTALGFTNGPGTLTLAGNNSFAGSVTAASGFTISLQHANALGATGGTNTVSSGGAMEVANGVTIGTGESVSIAGDGTSFIGALRAGTGGGTWAGGVTLNTTGAGPRIGATAANALTITGAIANGTGNSFNVSGLSGTGVVILNPTATNTYTGTTGIIRGILRLGKNDALPTGTTLDVDSASAVTDAASFDMASFSQTVAALQDSATTNINGIITNSVAATTSTLTVNQATSTVYDGIIQNGSGSVVLTKGGVGNLTLNGANTYTGGTNIKDGSITIGGGNDRLATGGSVVLGDVATTGKLILGDATTARNQTLAGLTATGLGGSVVGAHATNDSILTLSIASSNTFGGTLGGGGTNENKLALIKTGAGTLNLTGSNSYTGITGISAGILNVASLSDYGVASSIGARAAVSETASGDGIGIRIGAVTTGATLQYTGSTAQSTNRQIRISAANNTIDASGTGAGTLSFTHSAANTNLFDTAGARTLTLTGSNTDNNSFAIRLTDQDITAGKTSLTKSGIGTWVVSGANTYTGATTVSGGTLKAGSSTAFNNTSALVMSGTSTLDLNGFNAAFNGNFTTGASTTTITDGAAGVGTSTVTFNQPNNTTVSTAALITDGATRKVAVAFTNTNGAQRFTNANNTFSGGLTLLNNATGTRLEINPAPTFTGTPGAITKGNYGTGTITVGQAATDKAGIYISAPNITLANAVVANTGLGTDRVGTFRIDTTGNTLSGELTAGTSDFTLSTNGTGSVNLTGKITSTGSNGLRLLSHTLGGTALTVTLTNAAGTNDYAGNTTINDNAQVGRSYTLALGANNQLPNGAGKGDVVINTNGTGVGTLRLQGFSDTINGLSGNGTITTTVAGASVLTIGDNNVSSNFSGTISNTTGTVGITKIGTGTLTLSNGNSYSGLTTINAGSGVSRGVILATATNALGTGAVSASFNTGATTAQIQLSGGITLGNSSFTTTGDGSDGTVNGLIRSISGANIISGTVTLGSGGGSSTFRADGGASLALNGVVNANTSGRIATLVGAGDFSFGSAGAINNGSATNTLGFWSTNSGTTTINSAANSYSLATAIGNGNTLVVSALSAGGANSSIGAAAVAATNLLIDNGTLRYSGSTGAQSTNRLFSIGNGGATLNASGATAADTLSFTGTGALGFNGISGVGTSALETGNRTLTLTGTNTGANTLDSVIGDQDTAGGNLTSLSKTDTGTWVVGGTNTYTGATTVTAGTLLINGNISTSTLTTVSGTGTLGGNGFVGNTQIQTGGTLSPGNSIDDIGINGSLTLDLGSFSLFEINTTGNLSDLAIVTGLLTFGGTLDVNNVGSPLVSGDIFNLFDFGTASGTFTTVNLPILGSGLTWDQSQLYTNGTLAIIPEPNVAALIGALGGILLLRRRR